MSDAEAVKAILCLQSPNHRPYPLLSKGLHAQTHSSNVDKRLGSQAMRRLAAKTWMWPWLVCTAELEGQSEAIAQINQPLVVCESQSAGSCGLQVDFQSLIHYIGHKISKFRIQGGARRHFTSTLHADRERRQRSALYPRCNWSSRT